MTLSTRIAAGLTGALACLAVAAPSNAQLNHTGRYYGPNGSYMKCTTIGSYTNNSTYCRSGQTARDEDRRLASKNACIKRVEEVWDANNPEVFEQVKRDQEAKFPLTAQLVGVSDAVIDSQVAILRYDDPAYKAASKACFTSNGFN